MSSASPTVWRLTAVESYHVETLGRLGARGGDEPCTLQLEPCALSSHRLRTDSTAVHRPPPRALASDFARRGSPSHRHYSVPTLHGHVHVHVHIPSELELQTGEPPVQSSASPSKLCAMCPSGVIAFGIIATDRRCAQQAARSGTQSLNNDPQLAELTGSDGIVSCV